TVGTDNCVTAANPIGDKHNSPISSTTYAPSSHHTEPSCPCVTVALAADSTRKDRPVKASPSTFLIGLLGLMLRRSSHGQSQPNTGVSTISAHDGRYSSDSAVCGSTTLSRMNSAKPKSASAPISNDAMRLSSNRSASAAMGGAMTSGRMHHGHGLPLVITSEGKKSLVSMCSVNSSHEP